MGVFKSHSRFSRTLGGKIRFSGKISTVKCFENNPLVRKTLEEDGHGRVLVVDGGGSLRCALLGDNIAEMAYKNGWDGIIIHGCIRDSEDIGCNFEPGNYVYADKDGILVSKEELKAN
eukprot:jgi/Picre1/31303/NNA_006656.t1